MNNKRLNDTTITTRIELGKNENPAAAMASKLFDLAEDVDIPSGILHWSPIAPYKITEFDGQQSIGFCDQPTFAQLHLELYQGQRGQPSLPLMDELRTMSKPFHSRKEVPIALTFVNYHTPKKRFVAQVMAAARREQEIETLGQISVEQALDERYAVFASALLQDEFLDFTPLPHIHHGLDVRFIIPKQAFSTNQPEEITRLTVDFDDGEGFREICFDQAINISYEDDIEKRIQIRIEPGGKTSLLASFRFKVTKVKAPDPDESWNLTATQSYPGGSDTLAKGTAWVFYGRGHTSIENPIIMADGFGYGESSLDTIWSIFNAKNLAEELLNKGKDIIILGYKDKAAYIQENAFVAVACIEKAINERIGKEPLVVGGASMGGLVTRYALIWMEKNSRDHKTAKYFSYDTPHNGAWVPLILQYFAYYFEGRSDSAKLLVKLLQSFAAQQLLWGWIPSWDYSGPVSNNPLRQKLYTELKNLGWFPSKAKKYAIANGRGDGQGNGVPAGQEAFNWYHLCVGARPNTQPDFGTNVYLGDMWIGLYWNKYHASNIQPFDGAPGGRSDFFGQAADGAQQSGWGTVTINYRTGCFIPSISAVSLKGTQDIYADISALGPDASDFDEFICSQYNTAHVEVTDELRDWILEKIGGIDVKYHKAVISSQSLSAKASNPLQPGKGLTPIAESM
ncbi:MAG: hypothetical protein F6J92_03155 [Symploca sp. SIO1A3]|nr:hypothetical protein [Symploca sp. SIO1A3]